MWHCIYEMLFCFFHQAKQFFYAWWKDKIKNESHKLYKHFEQSTLKRCKRENNLLNYLETTKDQDGDAESLVRVVIVGLLFSQIEPHDNSGQAKPESDGLNWNVTVIPLGVESLEIPSG